MSKKLRAIHTERVGLEREKALKKRLKNGAEITQITVHRAIQFTVASTLILALFGSFIQEKHNQLNIKKSLSFLGDKVAIEASTQDVLEIFYSKKYPPGSDFIETFISGLSPQQVLEICLDLLSRKDPNKAGPLAILLAKAAARRYKSSRLFLLIAFEYINGNSVDKNFDQALEILQRAEFKENRLADYYRGLWWSDLTNPARDTNRAYFYLKKAEAQGVVEASTVLGRLGEQAQ